jgi:hypothetical protein
VIWDLHRVTELPEARRGDQTSENSNLLAISVNKGKNKAVRPILGIRRAHLRHEGRLPPAKLGEQAPLCLLPHLLQFVAPEWTYPEVADSFSLRHRNPLYRFYCSCFVVGRTQVT